MFVLHGSCSVLKICIGLTNWTTICVTWKCLEKLLLGGGGVDWNLRRIYLPTPKCITIRTAQDL